MMDDNHCFLAANPIKSLENARLAVKYGARNALHSPEIYIYMSPIPFGLMRLGILSSITNTQANFYYTLLIFIHVNRQVLHMTRIAYIIYYMPYTLSYIPLMIYHVFYIRCYILCITYYILYVLRWIICIVVYVIHHILNISILYVLYVVYYAYYTACATHASI